MPDSDLSDAECLELYQFLLERLDAEGFAEFRREVESAATAPIFDESSDEEDARVLKEIKGEVGQRALRRREPLEVFEAAIDVIWTRLIEFPRVAAAIETNLKLAATARVEFRVDYEEQYAPGRSEPVSLNRLQVTEAEAITMHELIDSIGVKPTRDLSENRGDETTNQRRD